MRARRNRATRHRIHRCTLELAERYGLREITVAQIAEAAGISARTFFRYFSNKEEALLPGQRHLLDAIETLTLSARTLEAALSEIYALGNALLEDDIGPELAEHRRVHAILYSDETLAAHAFAQDAIISARLAERVRAQLPGENPRDLALLADVAVAVWRQGWRRWADQAGIEPGEGPRESQEHARATLTRIVPRG